MSLDIVYPNLELIPGYHHCLSEIAKERIYLEMIEAPPLERVTYFQKEHISKNGPVYYAVDGNDVVGWCDVFAKDNPRQSHRGTLGMGLLPSYRGKGLGSKLISSVLEHSKKIGLEKIELNVYTTNTSAIELYKKFGFAEEGLVKNYRKLDGTYFDSLMMGKFL